MRKTLKTITAVALIATTSGLIIAETTIKNTKTNTDAVKTDSISAPLFKTDLSNAIFPDKPWGIKDGILSPTGHGDIWTKKRYRDFILELDFKCAKNSNSGVFLRCYDIKRWLNTCIEVQILQADIPNKKHICGAVFDCLAPTKNAIKPVGEWNHYKITVKDNHIKTELNGENVLDMDLDKWTEAGRNPDGSRNKFKYAYKDMSREGHIGLQYHGQPIWFRNVNIRELKKHPAPTQTKSGASE